MGVRLRAFFLAPAAAAREGAVRGATPRSPSVAVLATGNDAPAAGAALGVGLARACRAPCALVCTWTGEPLSLAGWGAPAPRAGRRLAARLSARGHDVRAVGRLVRLALPCEDGPAAAEAVRAVAAAGDVPTVLVVAAARDGCLEAVVLEQDHVVVLTPPGAPDGLAEIALAGLGLPDDRVSVHTAAGSPAARSLGLAGVAGGLGGQASLAATVRALA